MIESRQNISQVLSTTSCLPDDIRGIRELLESHGTFDFPILASGLFPAASLTPDSEYTGYENVWVRDNVHIAHAHYLIGRKDIATRNMVALSNYFDKHRRKFEAIIRAEVDSTDPMNRPHVRFNGHTLEENPVQWSHAQNDALGYYLWCHCRFFLLDNISPTTRDWDILGLFPLFFRAIQFWQDADSGHWEETRKVEASSIGTTIAGLNELKRLMRANSITSFVCSGNTVTTALIDDLLRVGRKSLLEILPSECIQQDSRMLRRYDSALLFLIYPLGIVDGEIADQIIGDVEQHLVGEYGIRRYLGDSFWCANYKALQAPDLRTIDVSRDMTARDSLLRDGGEAQWCIFDPILSTIFGRRYQETSEEIWLEKQIHYINRSLGQLTKPDSGFPAFKCPELYYLEGEQHQPNDVTPLLWTQANLIVALETMLQSAQLRQAAV